MWQLLNDNVNEQAIEVKKNDVIYTKWWKCDFYFGGKFLFLSPPPYIIKITIMNSAATNQRKRKRKKTQTHTTTAKYIGHQRYKVVARKSFVIWLWVWWHRTNLIRRNTFTKWWHDTQPETSGSGNNYIALLCAIHHTYQSNHKKGNKDENVWIKYTQQQQWQWRWRRRWRRQLRLWQQRQQNKW